MAATMQVLADILPGVIEFYALKTIRSLSAL